MSKAEVIQLKESSSEALIAAVQKLCLVRGDITLSSGQKSDHYFNMKPLMMNPSALQLAAKALNEKIEAEARQAEYVGGLEMGAVPLTAAVLALRDNDKLQGFFVRKAPKEHGLQKQIEGLPKDKTLKGKKVVLLEDVTTTGGSALQAAQKIQAEEAEVIAVITLLDREEGAEKMFAAAGIPLHACLTKSDIL